MDHLAMTEREAEAYFTKMRWPHGFRCPRCGHPRAHSLHSRRLTLYQCAACRYQTTVTSGTVMDKSRTPLRKWFMAMKLLSGENGVNAVQLAACIHVSYKTAWSMLHKIRTALHAAESQKRLTGTVHAGLMFYGSPNLQPYVPHPQEHPVIVASGRGQGKGQGYGQDNGQGNGQDNWQDNGQDHIPTVKIVQVPRQYMDKKWITERGKEYFQTTSVSEEARYSGLIGRFQIRKHLLLLEVFRQAKSWINRTFHGIGAKYQQMYWDEFCFRWNLSVKQTPVLPELIAVCTGASSVPSVYVLPQTLC